MLQPHRRYLLVDVHCKVLSCWSAEALGMEMKQFLSLASSLVPAWRFPDRGAVGLAGAEPPAKQE